MGDIHLTGAKTEDIRRVAAELARLQGLDPSPTEQLPAILDSVRRSVDAAYSISAGSYGERYWHSWLNTMEQAARRHLGTPLPSEWPRSLAHARWQVAREAAGESPESAARQLIQAWNGESPIRSSSDEPWVADYVTVARFLQTVDEPRIRELTLRSLKSAVEALAAHVEKDGQDASRLHQVVGVLNGLQGAEAAPLRAAAGRELGRREPAREPKWPVIQQLDGILNLLLLVLPSRGGGVDLWRYATILVYAAGVQALVRRPLEDAGAMPAYYLMRGLGRLYDELAAAGIGPDMEVDEAVGQASLALIGIYRRGEGSRFGQPAERTGFSGSDD